MPRPCIIGTCDRKNLFVPQRQAREVEEGEREEGQPVPYSRNSRSCDPFAHRENFSLTCHPKKKKTQKIWRNLSISAKSMLAKTVRGRGTGRERERQNKATFAVRNSVNLEFKNDLRFA